MKITFDDSESVRRLVVLVLAVAASSSAWGNGTSAGPGQSRYHDLTLAQGMAQDKPGQPVMPAHVGSPAGVLAWTFDAAQPGDGEKWTAERGTLTPGKGEARLQPDRNRRVVLLSPSGLPDAARYADEFVLGLSGTGLERVRIQARRDARGGWITIADASGQALRETADGFAIKRSAGARGASMERLRIELTSRTTNARPLKRITVKPA